MPINEKHIEQLVTSIDNLVSAMADAKSKPNEAGTGGRTGTYNNMRNGGSHMDFDELNGAISDLSDLRSAVKKTIQAYNEQQKTIREQEKEYDRLTKVLERAESTGNRRHNTPEEDEAYQNHINVLRNEIEYQKAKEQLSQTEQKNKAKAIENDTIYMRLQEKSYAHEMEIRNKKLKFEEEHLEKTQAIADRELKIQQTRQKYELLGYNKSGRKNSGAELFDYIGKMSAYFKGNSVGRIAGDAFGGITNAGAKAASFINNGKMDVGAMADKLSGALSKAGPYGAAAGGLIQILKTAFDMYSKVNTAASKFAKTVGGGAATIDKMQYSMAKVAMEISKSGDSWITWGKRAYDATKLLESAAEYSAAIGRTTEYLSNADFQALQDLKDFGIGTNIINQFDTFGISVNEVSERMAKMYGTASRKGLNVKSVTDAMTKNLSMSQRFTFAGGLRSLERMAERSVALKYNMESVSRFAEKVSTLEGAAQTGAGLSVLGGNFARMGNPLALLYGGLQDPERLNDMMLNAVKGMAQWDAQKGHLDLTGQDRMRLRAVSEQTGIDYTDLYNMTVNQEKQDIIAGQIKGGVDDETREYIKNIANIRKGKGGGPEAYVTIDGEDISLKDIDKVGKERLKKESEAKSVREGATLGDILGVTQSTQEKLDQILEQIKTKIAYGIMALVDWFVGNEHKIGDNADMAKYGFTGKENIDRFENLKKIRGKSQAEQLAYYKTLDENEQKRMQSMGWFNAKGEIQKSFASLSDEEVLRKYRKTTEEDEKRKRQEQAEQKKAHGGIIRGKGTSMSDSIPARLSDGEFVMNAKATSKHLPELQAMNAEGFNSGTSSPIRAGENQLKSISVNEPLSKSVITSYPTQSTKVEPITININGSIKLDGAGISKDIDASKLLTNDFVNKLLREIEVATHNSLNKANVRMKYPS